jgi:hypothetical protein
MTTRIAVLVLSAALVMTMTPSHHASANGAAFFADPDRISEDSTLYFGIVKDQKGAPVVGATIQIHIKGQNIEYIYQTTTLGRYRSIDLPRDTDPKLVEVVVQKTGFRTMSQDNRTKTVKAGLPVEINFVLTQASS